ncbi:MAG: DNA-3-methyladenine glycosylase I [Acinetobacter sp.]|nr:DNA-3-methyladenine glycosylase I [Acinetobacter sp.]
MTDHLQRCAWVSDNALYQQYHDQEWGVPVYDEFALFECLCLETQQAGLSWITVLKKRQRYREQFFHLSIAEIAQLSDADLLEKSQDAGLIRHLAKLQAIRSNAQAWLNLKQQLAAQGQDIVDWFWQFVAQQPIVRDVTQPSDVPAQTEISVQMSKTLKKLGFKFVGATICYAFMQAVGMVNDHENHCFCKSP